MSALRPLPPNPSLEFERKEAKALLRRLRAGDPDHIARARARHPGIKASAPGQIRLADAQLVIAREYGFTSWPKLVRYFGDVHRQSCNPGGVEYRPRDFFDGSVRGLLAGHRNRRVTAARQLAAYVPRFYGMRLDDVFASSVTEDDARLAVARRNGFPSWQVLLERGGTEPWTTGPDDWEVDPMVYAGKAMEAADPAALERVVQAHPELLHPTDYEIAKGRSLLAGALHHERVQGRAAMRPIMDWLAAQGLDLQDELNRQLCGRIYMETGTVRWLLDRGADPNWVAPNSIPVLEHALLRYWNGEAVDLVAARAVPRKALWIAAGLGDVDGVRRSLDARGKPKPAAYRLRPDFDAVGPPRLGPQHPDPDDEEILMEAFVIAMHNGRRAVLEYMVSRGFPVNSLIYGLPVIFVAAGNTMVSAVDCLVRCGADLDLRGWHPNQSAREIARAMFVDAPQQAGRRRVVELCGMDPDAILAEHDARRAPPAVDPKLREALEVAADDAVRLGQSDIRPENLLFGLLAIGGLPLMFFTKVSRMDLDRFRADVQDRVRALEDRVERPRLPLHPDAEATIRAAIAIATERRRETVEGSHLLYALTKDEDGAVAELLARYGSSAELLNAALEGAL
jgi:hypothetical protein